MTQCGLALVGRCVVALIMSPATVIVAQASAPARTFLAIGAHAGDAELTSGAVLAHQQSLGDRIVVLHLTLGEGGNPRLAPDAYGQQKRREAAAAANSLGAEVMFGPWRDGEVPNTDEARRWVADAIRQVRPTQVITHARESIHKDHATTDALVVDYDTSLFGVRGAEARTGRAAAFDIDAIGKKRVLDSIP